VSNDRARLRAWFVAIVCTLAMTVSYVDRQVLAALGPTVRTKLDFDATHFGWLTSAFAFSYLIFAPLSGALVDRIGTRRGLVVAVLVWSVVAAAQGAAISFPTLFAIRALLGAAESPSFPSAARTVRSVLPERDRSAGLGLLFTGSSIGSMIAGPLAIWLNVKVGWRGAFLVAAALGTAWVPLFLFATRSPATRAALAAAPQSSASRPRFFAAFREREILRAMVLVVGSAPAVMLVLNWFPQILDKTFHVAQNDQARYVWAPPAAFDLGAVGFGWIASLRDRRAANGISDKRALVALGATLMVALALVPRTSDPATATVLAAVGLAGGGAVYTLLTSEMLARVSPAMTATAGGMTAAAQSIAQVITAPLVGRSVDRSGAYTHALVALGVLAIPFALTWIALHRRAATQPLRA
jgi:ACS family hexuronate transporter-like MFS transporter